MKTKTKKKWLRSLIVLCAVGVIAGYFGWYKFLRQEPEPKWASEAERFKYGSIGAEFSRGIPYWIWEGLPRIFPDLTPGPGGYKSFGLGWEEGKEMPVGFTKRVIGFPRVANNCAICHVGTWRSKDEEVPHVVVAAPANTVNVQGLLRFLTKAGNDPRFNADTILAEIERDTKLSVADRLIYRFVLIPMTRSGLQRQEKQFAWMNRPHWPDWGTGRADPMNLTKYFMTSMPVDDSTGQADFPSNWNLKARKGTNDLLNWCGETPAVRSVLIDSALGLGAAPDKGNALVYPLDLLDWKLERRNWFLKRMESLEDFLSNVAPPEFPFGIDADLAAKGKPIYQKNCAECHEVGAPRTCKVVPISEIGTDSNRMATWTQAAADQANAAVKDLGVIRPNLIQNSGYCSPPLDGLWMRAPYLHNGSVPTLQDLLQPAAARPATFYRGYDVYDPTNLGFVSAGPMAERLGWRVDVSVRGNGNQGHEYGTALPKEEKDALIEYLKSL